MFNVQIVKDHREFEALRERWDSLMSLSENNSVFLTWGWLYHWWINFGKGSELFIILFRRNNNNELIAIAPLFIEIGSFGKLFKKRKVKFIGAGAGAADFLDFIIKPGYEEAVLNGFFDVLSSNQAKWDIVELADIDNNSKSLRIIASVTEKKFNILVLNSQKCPYIDLPCSYEELVKNISSKFNKNLRWAEKQLIVKHGASFFVNADTSTVEEKIDALFNLHENRFNQKKNQVSSFKGDKLKEFHLSVASDFSEQGNFRFYSIQIDKVVIACLYAFKYKDSLFYYQTGYNTEWGKFSAGMLVLAFAIKKAIDEKLKVFHFLRGEESYKSKWTGSFKSTKRIILSKRNMKGKLFLKFIKVKDALRATRNNFKRQG